jgi:murein DD-endopeptidase MepM/ murein hydrolase activator NlpD
MKLNKTSNVYSLPVAFEDVTLTVLDNASHTGDFEGSIDLAVPAGTTVFASADGTVVRVRDDSNKFGNDQKYGQDVNYITIQHQNDELSEYLHLAIDSALIKVGDRVKRGEKIAETGLSGWLTAPHLHWMVYKTSGFPCLQIQLDRPLK